MRSSNGISVRHGPHQGAQKSTSTGVVFDASTTAVMKFSTVASIFCAAAAMDLSRVLDVPDLGALSRRCKRPAA